MRGGGCWTSTGAGTRCSWRRSSTPTREWLFNSSSWRSSNSLGARIALSDVSTSVRGDLSHGGGEHDVCRVERPVPKKGLRQGVHVGSGHRGESARASVTPSISRSTWLAVVEAKALIGWARTLSNSPRTALVRASGGTTRADRSFAWARSGFVATTSLGRSRALRRSAVSYTHLR